MKRKVDNFHRFIKIFSITFFSISTIFLAYTVLFASKALPNTFFGEVSISGQKREQIYKIVDSNLEKFAERKVEIIAGSRKIEASLNELGVDLSSSGSAQNVQDSFVAKNAYDAYRDRLEALFYKRRITPKYIIDYPTLSNYLDTKLASAEKKAVDASIVFTAEGPKISVEQSGVVIDKSKLIAEILRNIDNLSSEPIVAVYVEDKPKIYSENARAALEKIITLNNQSIVLAYEFDKWTLSGETLADLLKFSALGADDYASFSFGYNPLIIKNINFKPESRVDLDVGLDNKNLSLFIDEISAVVDKPTVNATLEFDGQKVSNFTPAQNGKALNKNLARKLIQDTVSVENKSSEKNVVINLPVEETRAKIANEEINSLGIHELIASGVSYYAGSIPNRVFNIQLGSQFINGTLVPPGEVFSFTKLVGPVSAEQGFKQAYVISKGRTVLDDGGGICQVSSTVFRAALNAGLPIEERTSHAYRVAYYEQRGFGPGLDATIWSPTVDLKFRNDTGKHILIQTRVDSGQAKLQVDIYGTSDGRRVEISEPVLSNRRPAPEPLYQDDPTLPTGTVKQVDWAAEGLTSVFTRKVYRGDDIVLDDTFKSNFRPWQAVYLRGTGT